MIRSNMAASLAGPIVPTAARTATGPGRWPDRPSPRHPRTARVTRLVSSSERGGGSGERAWRVRRDDVRAEVDRQPEPFFPARRTGVEGPEVEAGAEVVDQRLEGV